MNLQYEMERVDKDQRRRDFRSRQRGLVAVAAFDILLMLVSGCWLFAALGVLCLTTAAQEAERFRRAGTMLQTRRTIYRGSTAHDARQRHLLRGWSPGMLYLPEHEKDRPDLAAVNAEMRRGKPA